MMGLMLKTGVHIVVYSELDGEEMVRGDINKPTHSPRQLSFPALL